MGNGNSLLAYGLELKKVELQSVAITIDSTASYTIQAYGLQLIASSFAAFNLSMYLR